MISFKKYLEEVTKITSFNGRPDNDSSFWKKTSQPGSKKEWPSVKNGGPEHDSINHWMNHSKNGITNSPGNTHTPSELYERYTMHCDEHEKDPVALPTFGRALGDHGVQKAKIAGRVRYLGIKMRPIDDD